MSVDAIEPEHKTDHADRLAAACQQDAWTSDVRTCLLAVQEEDSPEANACVSRLSEDHYVNFYAAYQRQSDGATEPLPHVPLAEPTATPTAGGFRCTLVGQRYDEAQAESGFSWKDIIWRLDGATGRLESAALGSLDAKATGTCTATSCEFLVTQVAARNYYTGTYRESKANTDTFQQHVFKGTWGWSADNRTNGGTWDGVASCTRIDE